MTGTVTCTVCANVPRKPGQRCGLCGTTGKDRRPLKQRLLDHYVEETADQWIFEPHPALDWATPAHTVDRGDAEAVHALIDRMDQGEFL